MIYILGTMGIVMIVSRWFFFKKQNIEPWKALIPFYSDYILFKMAGIPNYFYISCPCFILMILLIGNTNPSIMDSLCLLISEAVVLIALIIRSYYLGKALQQSMGISFLLFFFEPFVLLYLTFKKEDVQTA
ncbi:MAG: hypothetical protein HUJ53_10680 [Holdemanella sp.]|nr:hypothetical protein [Holdemanella sp.]